MVQTVKKTMNENLPFLKDSKYLSTSAWNTKCLWSKVLEELVVLKLFSMLLASILLPLLFSGRLVETSTNRSTQVALQHLYPREHSHKRQIRSSGKNHRTFVSQKFRSVLRPSPFSCFTKYPPILAPTILWGKKMP